MKLQVAAHESLSNGRQRFVVDLDCGPVEINSDTDLTALFEEKLKEARPLATDILKEIEAKR